MLTFPSNVRLFLANAPADMRNGFDGLSTLVESELGMSPLRGDLFIFLNRRAMKVRICSGPRRLLRAGKAIEAGNLSARARSRRRRRRGD